MEHIQSIVVGAGAVGLAVARRLAMDGHEVLILEAETAIGSGVSSRNSCVVHAGIYYPADSVRARVCVQGKHALYDFCASHGVSHQRTGKLIVATDPAQLPALDALRERAAANGVGDLERLDVDAARALEPEVLCAGALLSPSTGIVDVHEYMLALLGDAEAHGALLAVATPLLGGAVEGGRIVVETGGEEAMTLSCDLLVNSAALGAQAVAASLRGLDPASIPKLHYAKGNYFSLTGRTPFTHLVYPMPDGAWLGVHATLDLAGRCRFGPDLQWVDALDFDVDPRELEPFYDSIRRWWPGLPDGALAPDYSGIRPKIYGPGEPVADFLIQGADAHGVPGLINLYGIESPGLTSSLAIAAEVAQRAAAARPRRAAAQGS